MPASATVLSLADHLPRNALSPHPLPRHPLSLPASLHVVDVCAFYTEHGGGVRTYVEQKLARGAEAGHRITLIVPGADDRVEQRSGGGRIVHVASPVMPLDRRYRYFAEAAAVHAVLDAEQPDVVEASSPWRTASIVADWAGEAPRALVLHADPLASYAYRWFGDVASRTTIDRRFDWFWRHLRRTARRHDLVVVANADLARRMAAGGVRGTDGIATIPLGIDRALFSPAHRSDAMRRALLASCGLGEDAVLLLGVGRLAAEKRWPMVIDAVRRAAMVRPIGLVLIGDGPDRAKAMRAAGGNPHIRLHGPARDRPLLAAIMASADALIHGCESETFGLVAAEALASGLPLIVPDAGGASDFAAAGHAERYRAGDSADAAAAIARLIARDPGALRQAAARAGARVPSMQDHFTALFDRYRGVIESSDAAFADPMERFR